ncbi:TPA: glycosyltransferase [Streptococcus suis]|nr:glycosyltransferase [Streptococcus suis]
MLSIIIPVYNNAQFISRCLDSILVETGVEFEVLVIDDGSTDNLQEICHSYSIRDLRVRYVYQENAGVSVARNHGLELANGGDILFVDSDDYLVSGWGHAYLVAQEQNNDLTIFELQRELDGQIQPADPMFSKCEKDLDTICKLYLLTDRLNGPWCKVFKKKIIHEHNIRFPKGIRIGEDAIFVGQYLSNCTNIVYFPDAIYTYVDNQASASYQKNVSFQDKHTLFETKKQFLEYYPECEEEFYEKFLGDYLSTLRFLASYSSWVEFRNQVMLSFDYSYVGDLLRYSYLTLSSRRTLQLKLLTTRKFRLLFGVLTTENKLLSLKNRK